MKATHDLLVTIGALTLATNKTGGPPKTSEILKMTPSWTRAALVKKLQLLVAAGYVEKIQGSIHEPTRWEWIER